MKANLKGLGGVKGMLLLHGEKIAMVLVAVVALWFMYSSMTLPRLEANRQADDLQNAIRQTNDTVTRAEWPESGSEQAAEVREFKPVAKSDIINVDPKAYVVRDGWNQPVVAPTILRTDPALLNAIDLYAYGGSGLLSFMDESVRKARMVAEAQRQQELAKKAADEQERQQREQLDGERGGNRRNRRNEEGEFGMAEFDPEHPKRRPVEGMMRRAGVPQQGDERIERAYWATVVAKVPIREQMKLYEDAFQNAKGGYDPSRDFPRYVGYLVERSEVTRGKPLEWKRAPVFDCQKKSIAANKPIRPFVNMDAVNKLYEIAATEWGGGGQIPDVIDERYFDFILTLPLPPLVGRDWGKEATHPDIPLAINTPPLEEEIAPLAEQPADDSAEADEDATFRSGSVDPNQTIGASQYGPMGGRSYGAEGGGIFGGGYGGRPSMDGEMMGRGYSGGLGRGYGGEEGGGPMGYTGGRSASQRTTLPRGVDFWLLRFFDFTVEPGKKYKYRVRLVLADPNHGLPNQLLAPEVQDRETKERAADKARGGKTITNFRAIEEWSEPTPTVGIPLEGGVRLAKTKLPAEGKVYDEPQVTLLVESFALDENGNAIQAAKEKDFRRGYVANMVQDTEYLGPDGRWIDTMESFKFHTGITVLDVEGGEPLAKDAMAPARVLLMDPAGELYIRDELDDKQAVDYQKMLFEEDKRRGIRGEEGEFGGGPFGGEGGGFRGRGRGGR